MVGSGRREGLEGGAGVGGRRRGGHALLMTLRDILVVALLARWHGHASIIRNAARVCCVARCSTFVVDALITCRAVWYERVAAGGTDVAASYTL